MKIAVNTRLLLKNKLEGIGWFTYQTLKRITQNNIKDEFIFFFDRPYDKEFIFDMNVHPVVLFPPARHPLLWYWYFEYSIPQALKKFKPDVYLSTDSWTTLHSNIPTVNVIHDINFEHHPEFIENKWHRKYYQKYAKPYAQRATRLVAVSEYTKQDIIQTYGIPSDRIDIVHNGINESYHPIDEAQKNEIRQKYTEDAPYFISISSLHKRKNINNLLKAFDLYKNRMQNDMKLVFVGSKMWRNIEIDIIVNEMQYKEDVIFLGNMQPEELNLLLGAADALTYVSLFEGFGIPIIEAFQTETPVIASNVTSMPEVGGNAALYCTPQSPESIAEAMIKITSSPTLRTQLIENGRNRKQLYSWDQSAENLWACIQKARK